MIKKIVLALVAVLTLSAPAWALTQEQMQARVYAAGLTAKVEVYEFPEAEGFNAGYFPEENIIRTANFSRLPDNWQLYILYHEIGHALQHQSGQIELTPFGMIFHGRTGNPEEVEWDCDEYSINQLALERLDGALIQQEVLAEAVRIWGHEGERGTLHGNARDRMVNGMQKRARNDVQS